MALIWAIDVTIAGAPYRFATRPVTVDGEDYPPGLGDFELSKRATLDETIALVVTTADDWPARFAAAGWLIDGGDVTIWLVEVEAGAARRRAVFRGVVERVQWDVAGTPLQFAARHRSGSYQIPRPQAVIDQDTHPHTDGTLLGGSTPGTYTLAASGTGQMYPIILGYPGYNDRTGEAVPVVPVPLAQVDTVTIVGASSGSREIPEHLLWVVGIGKLEAADLVWYDAGPSNLSDGLPLFDGPADNNSVLQFVDLLGQTYTGIQQDWLQDFDGDSRMYVGFKPRAPGAVTFGGGTVWRGRVVRGAADLFEWMVRTYAPDVPIDYGAHQVHAPALNEYRFDTFINEPVEVGTWFEGAIGAYVPAIIARGRQGLYLAHVPWTDEHQAVSVELIEGENAQRGGINEAAEELVNELAVRYAPGADSAAYLNSFTLTAQHARLQAVPSGQAYPDPRAIASQWAKASVAAYGSRPGTLELPTVYDTATAQRVGADYLIAHALPVRTFLYDLPPERNDIEIGQIATLTDAGRSLSAVRCTVIDVSISTTRVTVTLRPLRYATTYL